MLAILAPRAAADTVVLKNGRKLEGVISQDGDPVVINPYNSRCPDMTWGIADKDRIPRNRVAEVVVADPPLVAYRERASRIGLSASDHLELARLRACLVKLKDARGKALLEAIANAWPDEPRLVEEVRAGIAEL